MTNKELYYNILLKKYNILKKNLIIIEQNDEKIDEFKNTIIELDGIEQQKFNKELEAKKELTTNLEDEYSRLCDYINLIENRYRRRLSMLEDYDNIVKDSIKGLEVIDDLDNLDFYNKRLEDIKEYLDNDKKYERYIEEKNEYDNILKDYEDKQKSLLNVINDFELNLLIKLKNEINNNSVYSTLDFDNLDENIKKYSSLLLEKENELKTYLNSFKALSNTNFNSDEMIQYNDFVEEEKKEYIELLEKKYILLMYKYINSNNIEESLKIYEERLEKISLYELEDSSNLKDIYDIINNFISKKAMLEEIELTIDSINKNIEQVNIKVNEIKKELNKDNIVSLLKEFCIEKDYIDNNIIDIVNEDDIIVEHSESENNNLIKDFGQEEILDKKDSEDDIKFLFDFNEEINEDFNDITEHDNQNIEVVDNESIEYLNEEIFKEDNENNQIFEINNVIDENLIANDNELDSNIKILEENEDENIDEIVEENDNISSIIVNQNEIVYKDNAIVKINDISSTLLIDDIRQKALSIMKSVCDSVI